MHSHNSKQREDRSHFNQNSRAFSDRNDRNDERSWRGNRDDVRDRGYSTERSFADDRSPSSGFAYGSAHEDFDAERGRFSDRGPDRYHQDRYHQDRYNPGNGRHEHSFRMSQKDYGTPERSWYPGYPGYGNADRMGEQGNQDFSRSEARSEGRFMGGANREPGMWSPSADARGMNRPFPGKGPKGYVRSDERIHEEVCELLSDGHLDASDIDVTVKDAEVTLMGTVCDRRTKRLAEELLEGVRGIKDIQNQLKVSGSAMNKSGGGQKTEGANAEGLNKTAEQSQNAPKSEIAGSHLTSERSNGSSTHKNLNA